MTLVSHFPYIYVTKVNALILKQFRYIFLLVFVALLHRSVGSVSASRFFVKTTKTEQSFKAENKSPFCHITPPSTLKRKYKPKKPKGIPVIVPNLEKQDFHSFSRYADFKAHEVKSCYSLLVTYAHGKRGPPVF